MFAQVEHWESCEVCRRRREFQAAGASRDALLDETQHGISGLLLPCAETIAFLEETGGERSAKLLLDCLLRHSAGYDATMLRRIADALVTIGPDATEPICRFLANARVAERLRIIAAEVLGRIGGDSARAALLHALRSGDVALRVGVTGVLGRYGDESVLPALCSRLGDHYLGVREAAAAALVQLAHPSAFPYLERMIRDGDAMTRRLAAMPLACTGNPEALPLLCSQLAEPIVGVRSTVAHALSRFGEAGAMVVLARENGARMMRGYLLDPEPAVREWAALGLGLTLDREQLPLLRRRLWKIAGEEEPSVREALRRAVVRIEQSMPDMRGLPRSGNNAADPAFRPRQGAVNDGGAIGE